MKIEVSGPALIPSQIGAQTIVPMCPLGEIAGREVAIEIDYVRVSIAAVDSSGDTEKRGKSRERKQKSRERKSSAPMLENPDKRHLSRFRQSHQASTEARRAHLNSSLIHE